MIFLPSSDLGKCFRLHALQIPEKNFKTFLLFYMTMYEYDKYKKVQYLFKQVIVICQFLH